MVMRINGTSGGAFSQRHLLDRERERKPKTQELQERPSRDRVDRNDGPSEQLRADVAGLNQAIQDTEKALAIAICAMDGLEEVAGALGEMESIVSPQSQGAATAESGDPGVAMERVAELLERIKTVAISTRFGRERLLDGAMGCTGAAVGDGLSFISASDAVRSSPPEGYEVLLTHEPVRATMLADVPLTAQVIARGTRLALSENGRKTRTLTRAGQSPENVAASLQAAAARAGLDLVVEVTPDGRLVVQHLRFGSAHQFLAASTEPGVLSTLDGKVRRVANGQDIAGTIHGEPASGRGRTLRGDAGNTATDGLVIRYTGLPFTGINRWLPRSRPAILEPAVFGGRVILAQQAMKLNLPDSSGGILVLRLDSMRPEALGGGEETESGFASLVEIRLDTPRQAADALRIIQSAQGDLAERMAGLRELTQGRLPAVLSTWRVKAQNLYASDSATGPGTPLNLVHQLSAIIRSEGKSALSAQTRPSRGSMMELLVEDVDNGKRLN